MIAAWLQQHHLPPPWQCVAAGLVLFFLWCTIGIRAVNRPAPRDPEDNVPPPEPAPPPWARAGLREFEEAREQDTRARGREKGTP